MSLSAHFICDISMSVLLIELYLQIWVQFLSQEDTIEKKMATHSSIPAWKIPWAEEPGRLQTMGLQESDTT